MHKAILALSIMIALFTVFVVFSSVVLTNKKTLGGKDVVYDYPEPTNKKLPKSSKESWVQNMAEIRTSIFPYSVNEMYLEVDLQKEFKKTNENGEPLGESYMYNLSIIDVNSYSSFFLIQTVSELDVPYSVEKNGGSLNIKILSQKKEMIDEVVKKLQEKEIEVSITKTKI